MPVSVPVCFAPLSPDRYRADLGGSFQEDRGPAAHTDKGSRPFHPQTSSFGCLFIDLNSRLSSPKGGPQRNLRSPPLPQGPHMSSGRAAVSAVRIRERLAWTQVAGRFWPGRVFVTWSSETHNDSRPASQVGGYKC